jgi:GntR family transcriptional repressor for pyruvate dehydrogenase complex
MRKKLTYEVVYDEIKNKLKKGLWKPGDKIPPIEQISIELKVGISSVREAIRILGKQHILRIEQGRGTYVQDDFTDLPSEQFDFLENASMLQLTEARLILEPELAALAAERASDTEIQSILRNSRKMKEKIKAGEDFLKEDIEFHDLIARAGKNQVLSQMLSMIGDLLLDSRRRSMKWKGMNEKAVAFHLLIADAIAQKNPTQAKSIMKCHLEDMMFTLKKDNLKGRDER